MVFLNKIFKKICQKPFSKLTSSPIRSIFTTHCFDNDFEIPLDENLYWDNLQNSLEESDQYTNKLTKAEKNVFILQLKMQYRSKSRQSTTPELQLAESISLVDTLDNWRVIDSHIVSTKRSHSREIFGSGNQEMLSKKIASSGADSLFVVIDRLTNMQVKGLRTTLLGNNPNMAIYDRYKVVLEIFKRNARSSIAKLQIALAEIPYLRHRYENKIVNSCIRSINRAKKLEKLNILISDTFDLAEKQAFESEKRWNKNLAIGRLDGRTFTVKDNISTESIRTTCGSKMLENYTPSFNATVVDRLLKSGSLLVGKTNLDEFGMGSVSSSYFGTVKNPYNVLIDDFDEDANDFYISGGSSGGSAASVSSGIVDFSIGSDTGGSVRNPASICGCIGFKPTYGMISRFGLIPLNNYLDTIGIMSRKIDVLVDVFNTIAGPDPNDATSLKCEFKPIKLADSFNTNEIKIGIPKEFFPNGLSEESLKAWKHSVGIFEKFGNAKIVSVSIPNIIYSMSVYSVLTSCEVASNFARYDGIRYGYHSELNLDTNPSGYNFETVVRKNRDESLGQVVRSRIVSGNYFLLKDNYEKYFLKSHKIKQLIVNDFLKVFNDDQCDLLVTPSCFNETFKYSHFLKQSQVFDEKDFFTSCANVAGLPAITLPCILSQNSLPIGIQLISKWKRDDLILNIANWFINKNGFEFLADNDKFLHKISNN
ncbi:glutamyl-tRNA(Gln) amidotransferase subunit mitochondrial [Brachionus plicatilis]|uniref:Glutamyl-tRNA(Gln) amidotransferase subunit A, mitochondrial n=1 Tax=Brachionus plicatilis TaxID=10195 RepID=A0A3M7QFB1_BRAPC|nr:glutamyl-tRNA(Gln) amidotransferase subunit mitochondrial [Brachionus plicatilis]